MKDIENRFTYHKPDEEKIERYERVREHAKHFAYLLDKYCPEGREKSLAITKLEEAVMWANAAIARDAEDNEVEWEQLMRR